MDAGAWRLIRMDEWSLPGARNMAVDQALLEGVAAGAPPALRFYGWSPACLSFGRNQPAAGRFDAAAAAARGIDMVRRPTGGAAVYHDRELTYALVVRAGVLGTPRATYETLNRALAAGLRLLGIPATVAGGTDPGPASRPRPSPLAGVCFQAQAPGEVVVGGRKLVGSAQRCRRRTVLQHGSILLDGGQALVSELSIGAAAAPAGHAAGGSGETTIAEVLGRVPALGELEEALAAGFETVLGIRLAPVELSAGEAQRADELEARFASAAWTWRV